MRPLLRRRMVVLGIVMAGCTTPVYLQHPTTKQVAKCGPYDARPLNSLSSAQRERGCVEDFQRQGYERMAQPPE